MVPAQTESGFGSWIVEEHLIRVDYSRQVVEDICALAIEGLFRFRHGGIEVGGVLYGTAEDGLVRVLAFRPLSCEHAFGPRFVLSDKDRAQLRHMTEQPDAGLDGLAPVGWYHSHTRSDVALSPRDLEIYDRYFSKRWQVALVIRPEQFGPARAGFFFREANGVVRTEESYDEFTIQPRRRVRAQPAEPEEAEPAEAAAPPVAAEEAEPPVKEAEPGIPEAEPPPFDSAAASAADAELALPSFTHTEQRRTRKWLWLPAVLALAALGFFTYRYYLDYSAVSTPLSLWVADVGGQLLIEWDRTARPVREAQRGWLEIHDGNDRMEIQMDGERLREGSVDYARRSEAVDVRLRVERPGGGQPAQEMIRFLGQPVQRGDTAGQANEIEQLKAEVEKLRGQLAQKDAQVHRLRGETSPGAAPTKPGSRP